MTTDLEDRLRAVASELSLDRALTAVVERGGALRRHRRLTWASGAAGVLLVACGAAVVAERPADPEPVATDPTPSVAPSVAPSPTTDGAPDPDPDPDLASAERACGPGLPDLGVPRDQPPLAGGSRDGLSIVLYHYGDRSSVCTTKRLSDGRVQPTDSQANGWNPLLPGQSFRPVALMTGPLAGGRTVDGMALFLVRDDVARFVLHMDGADVDAEVHDGVAILWLPDDLHTAAFATATVTTYDAGGHVLEDRPVPTDPGSSASPADPDQQEMAAAEPVCRSSLTDVKVPLDGPPVAAGTHNSISTFVYRFGDEYAVCTAARTQDGTLYPMSSGRGDWAPFAAGRTFQRIGFTATGNAHRPLTMVSGAFQVASDVTRLVLHVEGEDVDATIDHEVALLWIPDGQATWDTIDAATVTTYDADGDVLETGPAAPQKTQRGA